MTDGKRGERDGWIYIYIYREREALRENKAEAPTVSKSVRFCQVFVYRMVADKRRLQLGMRFPGSSFGLLGLQPLQGLPSFNVKKTNVLTQRDWNKCHFI